jgi:hypothetical protein
MLGAPNEKGELKSSPFVLGIAACWKIGGGPGAGSVDGGQLKYEQLHVSVVFMISTID